MRRPLFFIVLCLLGGTNIRGGDGPAKDLLGDPLPVGAAMRLGTVRLRHAGPITVTAWAPDGKLLATGGGDELIRLWDAATGKEVRQLRATSSFTALAFFNDGKTLVSADQLGYLRLWNVESGREFRRFGNIKDRVTRLAVAPDNRTLFSAGADRIVRQWLVAGGVELRQFDVHQGSILALAFTADGKELRTAAADNLVRVFDTATGMETRRFAIECAREPSVAIATFSKGGRELACTRPDLALNVYDADSGKLIRSVGSANVPLNGLDFSPNGKFLATAFAASHVRVFGVASGKEIRVFDTLGPHRVAFSPDGQTLAVSTGESMRLWHVADDREALPLPGHTSAVESLCFSRDGTLLVTAGDDRTVRVWNRATGKEIARLEPDKVASMKHVSVGTGPRSFVTVSLTERQGALEWALKDNNEIRHVHTWDQSSSTNSMAVSLDSKMVALAGADPTVSLVDTDSKKILSKLDAFKEGSSAKVTVRATSLAFSPDGKLLAIKGAGRPIEVWNVAGGRLVRTFDETRGSHAFAFSPNSRLLAVAAEDLKLYEIATGQERQHIAVPLRALVFSPDGRYVITSLSKGGIQFFDASTGLPVGQLGAPGSEGAALAFSPDGTTLASAGPHTAVMLWTKLPWREPTRTIAPLRLEPAEVEILWKILAQPDGRRAHQAVWALAGAPELSIPFIKKAIKPGLYVSPKQVEQYLRNLDCANFELRQTAMRELESLGDAAEDALLAALKTNASIEARRRIEDLLSRVNDASPQKLQMHRALEVLEYAATDDAQLVMETLAQGGAGHWLTNTARTALERQQRNRRLTNSERDK